MNACNAGLSTHHYKFVHAHPNTPCVIVLPLIRFYNNNHITFKACMTLEQSSATECFVAQGGCGRIPNRVSLWKVAMTEKPAEAEPVSSSAAADSKMSAEASISKVNSRVVLDYDSKSDAKSGRLAGDESEEPSTDYDHGDDEEGGVAEQAEAKAGAEVEADPDAVEEGSCADDATAGSQEKKPFRHTEYECLLVHPAGGFTSSTVSTDGPDAKGELGFDDYEEPEIPANSYLAHDEHVLLGLRELSVASVVNTFNFPLTPLMQPSCLQLQLISTSEIREKANTVVLSSQRSTKLKKSNSAGNSTVVPQYIYVGLGDGPIYKIILI